jgi:hypothetical protein
MMLKIMDWLRKIPDWLIVLVLGILAGKWYVEREKDHARKDEQARAAAREQEARLEATDTLRKIERQGQSDADKALNARDTAANFSGADSVPDEVAARIFKD